MKDNRRGKRRVEKLKIVIEFDQDRMAEFLAACILDGGNTPEEMVRRLIIEYMEQFSSILADCYDRRRWTELHRKAKGLYSVR